MNSIMSNMAFKGKLTKREFEHKLVVGLGSEGLSQSPYVEEGKKLTLYYKNDRHVGTWMNGVGWVFEGVGFDKQMIAFDNLLWTVSKPEEQEQVREAMRVRATELGRKL